MRQLMNRLSSFLGMMTRPGTVSRRDLLKALSTIPVIGILFYSSYLHTKRKKLKGNKLPISNRYQIQTLPNNTYNTLNVGIIGFGLRGEQLCRAAGYAHPDWISHQKSNFPDNLKTFLKQEDLNINISGICDLFDDRAERGIVALKTGKGSSDPSVSGRSINRYRTYREMLDDKDIDAVIIATPDFRHSQITLDAIDAHKHIYWEKCMTHSIEEAHAVHTRLSNSNVVFQLGHHNRQQESFYAAEDIVSQNILGDISLVEVTTNRNSDRGAWVLPIPESASPDTVDWDQFQEGLEHTLPFAAERFFRWRCWYDYSTGIAGDLLSHEFDILNQILKLGIPDSVTATGGIYYHKDGRDTPDTFQVTLDYPDRELVVLYSATLANGRDRGRIIMGSEATMELGSSIDIYPEANAKFLKKNDGEKVDLSKPYYQYIQGSQRYDGITSASDKYFASRGLMYSTVDGQKYDVSHLHVRDWINCIRNGETPKCNYEIGFEEAITCHMATLSYKENRKVTWNRQRNRVL